MAHFVRTQADGTWVNGYVPVRSDFESLDLKQFLSINGDRGGTWSPQSNIVFGGSGLVVTGPLVVFGSSGRLNSAVNLFGDFPLLGATHKGRTRTIVQSLSDAQHGVDPVPAGATLDTLPNLLLRNGHSVQFACTDVTDQQNLQGPVTTASHYSPSLVQEIRVVDGSTLSQVEFRFRVATPRKSPPGATPRFRVFRVKFGDGSIDVLQSVVLGADDSGYASPALPSSGAAWYAGGQAQGFVYKCDQNNIVDRSRYAYYVEIIEESGNTDAPLAIVRYPDVACADAFIPLITIDPSYSPDGVTLVAGDLFLVIDAYTTRRKDLAGVYPMPATSTGNNPPRDPAFLGEYGSIVRVLSGNKFRFLYMQQQAPGPVVLGTTRLQYNTSPDESARERLRFGMIPAGNIYHSAVTTFTGITDTRWQ